MPIPPPQAAPARLPPEGWWEAAFAKLPTPSEQVGHPCAHHEMLTLIAYDISNPKRLAKVARYCENHGVRVQYSVFECRLPAADFHNFWLELEELIDPTEDRLVAYRICASCARHILSAGATTHSAAPIAYVF